MSYVLTAELQSDRLEGEFGIYRQLSGGNFHISVLQVFNGLSFQRIKLFHKLEVEKQSAHENDQCCTMDITDSELDMIDACFQDATDLTVIERSSLYYISGYITCKEKIDVDTANVEYAESEFTTMVSRGKLCHPSEELFDLSLYLYTYYKSLEDKSCSTRLLRAFERILEFTSYSIPAHNSVLRRFANCFGKAFSKKASQQLRIDNESKCIKKLRMSNR